jgi:hypothetical protein
LAFGLNTEGRGRIGGLIGQVRPAGVTQAQRTALLLRRSRHRRTFSLKDSKVLSMWENTLSA